MKIFLISQEVNNNYETYDSAVVCAENEDEARKINPSGYGETPVIVNTYSSWCSLKDVKVECIGEANVGRTAGIICASFNAG